MRATIVLDDDVHQAIKEIAKDRRTTGDRGLSELCREEPAGRARLHQKRNNTRRRSQ